jgi:hypothetical protein
VAYKAEHKLEDWMLAGFASRWQAAIKQTQIFAEFAQSCTEQIQDCAAREAQQALLCETQYALCETMPPGDCPGGLCQLD